MTEPLRVFIVDDEPPARERLAELLEDCRPEVANVSAGEAANGVEALARLPAARPDVVLVDVHMPGMNGIELARHIRNLEHPPAVIFVTAFDQYAVQAFEVNALDYLLKPVRAARLAAALLRAAGKVAGATAPARDALEKADTQSRRFLSVSERGRLRLVPVADILYLRAELKYVTVRTVEREFIIEESLTQLEQEFEDRFLRVHRSCLVARDRVRGLERLPDEEGEARWAVMLEGAADPIPVSRRQFTAVKQLVKGEG